MAELHLVTGYKGTAHITSADQGIFNAMSVGADDYVFTKGKRFEAQIMSNNIIRILDGSLMMNGRQVNLDSGSYIDVTVSNGVSGLLRNDIIAVQYHKNITTGIESADIVILPGTASSSPQDPTFLGGYGNIIEGDITHFMPLYRVRLEGLNIVGLDPLFQVLAPMADIQHGFYKQNMLINGDFQCNQRGEKTYTATPNVSKYTVDMWRAFNVSVQKLNEGVTLTALYTTDCYFTQFIQLGKLKTTTYTISAMADDKICTFTVTPGGTAKEKNFGKFKITALTISTWDDALGDYNNKLKINICPLTTDPITFKYIDVFEGTVAYPHVKEDYATALMRCKQYVQAGVGVSPILHEGKVGQYRIGIPFSEMHSAPTLESCSWSLISSATNDWETGDISYFTVLDTTKNFLQGRAEAGGVSLASYVFGIRISYLLTCEYNK